MARDYLTHLARREPSDPAVLAAAAQAHATLAMHDRLGAVIDRLAAPARSGHTSQDEADDAAIDRAIAQGRPETDAVLRFVREELGFEPLPHQEQMLRRLVTASIKEHPLQAADRAWYEAQKRNAIAAGDPQGIRTAVDGINRSREESRFDPDQQMRGVGIDRLAVDEFQPDGSQYAAAPTEMERTWSTEAEIDTVLAVEATIDPDVAATNARRRREERERAAMDRQVNRGTGVFGQMSGEDA